MNRETRPEKWVFLHDMEQAAKRVVALSNGHEPIEFSNTVVYRGLQDARVAATDAGLLAIDYDRHLNGAHNARSIVHDSEGGRTIMGVLADFTEEDSDRGQALRDAHLTRDVVFQASIALFGDPEAPIGE